MSARLILLRHSKAARPEGVADHARPLAERGRADAEAVGRWLAAAGLRPDLAVVSDAVRTRETWTHVVAGMGPTLAAVPARYERRAYDAGPAGLLALLTAVEPELGTVLLVGHNPAVEDLAADLDDGTGPEQAREALADGLPTSGVVVLEPAGAWAELAPHAARLVEVVGRPSG